MNRPIWPALLATALLLAACAAPIPTRPPTYRTFDNAAAIAIPTAGDTAGPADPYPSTIFVDDMPTVMSTVRVRLTGFSHAWSSDVDVLLVGPQGEHTLLLSDAGGPTDADDVTLIFEAAATETVPQGGPIVSGAFLPSAYDDGDTFAAPAPAGPYATDLSVFEGTDPNGIWSLFIVDDVTLDIGSIAGGWSLTFLVD